MPWHLAQTRIRLGFREFQVRVMNVRQGLSIGQCRKRQSFRPLQHQLPCPGNLQQLASLWVVVRDPNDFLTFQLAGVNLPAHEGRFVQQFAHDATFVGYLKLTCSVYQLVELCNDGMPPSPRLEDVTSLRTLQQMLFSEAGNERAGHPDLYIVGLPDTPQIVVIHVPKIA
jgi:hypothetical protein